MPQPSLSVIENTNTKPILNLHEGSLQRKVEKNASNKNIEITTQDTLELSNKLHQHLELKKLINYFTDEVKPLFKLDDVIYKKPNEQEAINNKGRHFLSYNLVFNNKELGEIFFIRRYRFVDEEAIQIEKVLISLLSPLVNAVKYYQAIEKANTDPLTGALNRLGLDGSFNREISLARRNKDDLSLLVLDIDHFKQVNDNYGHDFGDTILKEMSKHIQTCVRTTDVFARFGGEEFVVLLNNTNRSGALLLAERIRHIIASTPETNNGKEVSYSVSIGVATLNKKDTRETLFKRADNALYQAKDNGRNRVVLSQD